MLALMAVTHHQIHQETPVTTTPIYTQYETFREHEDIEPLSHRRFRDRLDDLADTKILNKRQGRGRGDDNQYSLAVDLDTALEDLLREPERLGDVAAILRAESGDTV